MFTNYNDNFKITKKKMLSSKLKRNIHAYLASSVCCFERHSERGHLGSSVRPSAEVSVGTLTQACVQAPR